METKYKGYVIFSEKDGEEIKVRGIILNFFHSIAYLIVGVINSILALFAAQMCTKDCKFEMGTMTYSGLFGGIFIIAAIICYLRATFKVRIINTTKK